MKRLIFLAGCFACFAAMAQDTTGTDLLKSLDSQDKPGAGKAVKVFDDDRLINNNSTEIIDRGKMEFKVTHIFDDVAGNNGGIKKMFGLDNSTEVRIGFHVGLTDRLNFNFARAKGNGALGKFRAYYNYEMALKYQLCRQVEKDPKHPFAITLFFSNVISAMSSKYVPPRDALGATTDTALNQMFAFEDGGERMSQVYQLIIAKKFGRVSLQLSPTLVHQGRVVLHDQQTVFALGAAVRFPLGKSVNLIVDYTHPFRSESSEEYFKSVDNSFNPPSNIDKNPTPFKFRDPLGIGFEIITAGHIFHLNFTNTTEAPENRFIPYTFSSWGNGQFHWGFTISRTFVLWRPKVKETSY